MDGGKYLESLTKHFNCSADTIKCNGCGALTPECWGNKCKIVQCLEEKGYTFCFECDAFAIRKCEQYEEISRRYLESNVDIRTNLSIIKAGKIDEWLKESEEIFTCKSCRKPVIAVRKTCHHCGVRCT